MIGRERANAMLMSVVILCLGLAGLLVYVWNRDVDSRQILDIALADPEVKREVVAELVTMSYGVYDSHPDPDVGRVFQPNIEKEQSNLGSIVTNDLGLRERAFDLPKQPGTVRVVLLGDSYVFGNMVEADQRLGVHLEEFLAERSAGHQMTVECLHIGVPSWNILSESAFLRRRIMDFRPDLVVHVVVPNDLDDLQGVRGFGVLSTFDPGNTHLGTSLVSRSHGNTLGIRTTKNYLLEGADFESRTRYRKAREAIGSLSDIVEAVGGRYVLMLNWMAKLDTGHRLLASGLEPDQVLPLPFSLFLDQTLRVSPRNGHWNAAGHRHVAKGLYAFVQRHGLLPSLGLTSWDEADDVLEGFESGVRDQLARDREVPTPPLEALDFRDWGVGTLEQIYGGVYGVNIAPRASVVLAVDGGRTLRIEGQFLSTPAMTEATVRVFVEGRELSVIPYAPGQPLVHEARLPADLFTRSQINVRIETDDFVHGGEDGRTTVSLLVATIAVVD